LERLEQAVQREKAKQEEVVELLKKIATQVKCVIHILE